MAVIKFTNSKNSLKGILNYITQAEKTEVTLVSGKDCVAESAFQEMQTIKRMYGKDSGRQYVHLVQSFAPSDPLTHEVAHEIGCKLVERFEGFQAVIATHKDRDHIHNHIVLNSVNMVSGLKFQQSQKQMQAVKDFSDKLCLEHGLSVITEKARSRDISRNEYKAAEKGTSWKFKLMNAIDNAMANSQSKAEFFANMKRLGYQVKWQSNRKYITYTTAEGKRCRDNKLHDDKYLKENMEAFYEQRGTQGIEQAREHDGAVQCQTESVRHSSRNSGRFNDTIDGNRKITSNDTESNREVAELGGYYKDSSSYIEEHREKLSPGIGRCRGGDGNTLRGADFNFDGAGDGRDRGVFGNFQSEEIATHSIRNHRWSNRYDVATSILGAAMVIENLLNPPEKEKKEKTVPKVKKRKKYKKKQIQDNESELEF